jgi:hypothetical protein
VPHLSKSDTAPDFNRGDLKRIPRVANFGSISTLYAPCTTATSHAHGSWREGLEGGRSHGGEGLQCDPAQPGQPWKRLHLNAARPSTAAPGRCSRHTRWVGGCTHHHRAGTARRTRPAQRQSPYPPRKTLDGARCRQHGTHAGGPAVPVGLGARAVVVVGAFASAKLEYDRCSTDLFGPCSTLLTTTHQSKLKRI